MSRVEVAGVFGDPYVQSRFNESDVRQRTGLSVATILVHRRDVGRHPGFIEVGKFLQEGGRGPFRCVQLPGDAFLVERFKDRLRGQGARRNIVQVSLRGSRIRVGARGGGLSGRRTKHVVAHPELRSDEVVEVQIAGIKETNGAMPVLVVHMNAQG